MKLWLVRHAPAAVAAGLCYGRSDVPADEAATRTLARDLAGQLSAGLRIRSSPLARCRHLADTIAAFQPGLRVTVDERLREMDFGRWELQPWDAIGVAELRAWTDDFAAHRPGGGESVQTLLDRVACALEDTRRAQEDTLWVTHAGVIRAVKVLLAGVRVIEAAAQWPAEPIPFGTLQVHELGPN